MDTWCGLWVDPDGRAHTAVATTEGGRIERQEPLRPFAWIDRAPTASSPGATPAALASPGQASDVRALSALSASGGLEFETLRGNGAFEGLVHADSLAAYDEFISTPGRVVDAVRPLESQFLLQRRGRLFADLPFAELRRCQLDIETASADGSFSDASRRGDRVLAIGLRSGGRNRLLLLEEMTDMAEAALLRSFNEALTELDPDVIEGHNVYKFDFDYLRKRSRMHRVPCAWGRFGREAAFRNSRLRIAERTIDFPRCDLPGRAIVDTYLLVQQYDITTRELTSYKLKEVAVYFGITDEDGPERTYIEGNRIAEAFERDRARFRAYLEDDLRETEGVASLLLPTYFEQTRTFPITLQEATLRGTTAKIDLLFLEEYYHARQACPRPPEIRPFEGGYTRSFREGVFRHVLHFDVASLYPSLLMQIGRNPADDTLGVFIPMLTRLRDYRLRFKQLARSAPTESERAEAQARQASFKILINSFYGYLGFSGARFGDGDLAAEVTRRGRGLLQSLIDEFTRHGATILEADTDGIYLSSEMHFAAPEALLALAVPILPAGIELEFDGKYEAMFCYKAKNYALYDGTRIIYRGSALRSRGIEPFLKKLSDGLIRFLLGASNEAPLVLLEEYRRKIGDRSLPVEELSKTETLGMNPAAYEGVIALGGKPRRASAEAALQMNPRPRMGDRVTYYITPKQKGRSSDWQRARPVDLYDAASAPYDSSYYLAKLDDWLERYGPFLGVKPPPPLQGELPMS